MTRPSPAERGYDAAWRDESLAWLERHPLCVRCRLPASVCDHVVRRRWLTEPSLVVRNLLRSALGPGLFEALTDNPDHPFNRQSLCGKCHRAKTGDERRGRPDFIVLVGRKVRQRFEQAQGSKM